MRESGMPSGVRRLSFSGQNVEAVLVEAGTAHEVEESAIVVNLSPRSVRLDPASPPLRPWRSTMLRATKLRASELIAVLRVVERDNIGRITLDPTWRAFGPTLPAGGSFPIDTPLWISTQDEIGVVEEDRQHFTGEAIEPESVEHFSCKLNLWYAPPFTDCFIHTGHKFLEVHTQLHGTGRMQKFRGQDANTLFEEVWMTPGFTHESFAIVEGDFWRYPWHRYYADTDCIWLAIELHP